MPDQSHNSPPTYYYIVQLETGVYLTSGEGDPPRTRTKANAKRYLTISGAFAGIRSARRYRKFPRARFEKIELKSTEQS